MVAPFLTSYARFSGLASILTGQSGETMTRVGQAGKRGLAARVAGRYLGAGMAQQR
ncbi:hypothetical protein SPO1758 [Ruegeria pomeroyi DSS-3]|uniref:Uncharacterized protein n=2 Tax=Ruegeria pomeroyi TaxID=89184 RepID=Q5LSK9_RUEPO|nr:hypothetical protein SPO1758 [Ruegeria pomeroyi DSS-3]NVK98084.1 hypothetical protein [Ruegeria pomeroyi]